MSEDGVASWYGVPYHGRPAADGEIYDMEQLVAAHRTMPFNTWVRVTNLSNGLSVNVRIIDRGPYANGRVIDLSKAAARQIQMIGPGTTRVHLEIIAAPVDKPADDFYAVQIAALANYSNAEHLRSTYADRFGSAQITIKQGRVPLYRILVGKESSPARAQEIAGKLRSELGHEVFVVRLDSQARASIVASPTSPSVAPLNPKAADHQGLGQENLRDTSAQADPQP
jgi:rare lipoprotein A